MSDESNTFEKITLKDFFVSRECYYFLGRCTSTFVNRPFYRHRVAPFLGTAGEVAVNKHEGAS